VAVATHRRRDAETQRQTDLERVGSIRMVEGYVIGGCGNVEGVEAYPSNPSKV